MPDPAQSQVTRILAEWDGRPAARDELFSVVYDQLRAIAQKRMAAERGSHTLQATALVHEAFVRLVEDRETPWANRAHFYSVAAEAMRRILVDHARKRGTKKRGGDVSRAPMGLLDLAEDFDPGQMLALDEALSALEDEDPRAASVVRLRFFAGLDVPETAASLDLSERTVMREWAYARARLFELLAPDPD